jgi:hypothetical protein
MLKISATNYSTPTPSFSALFEGAAGYVPLMDCRINRRIIPVIWATQMGSAGILELIRYYRDRSVWLIEPDQSEAGANSVRD